jgi:hypothetical protein
MVSHALGTGSLTFAAPANGSATLLIAAAGAPQAGTTFANTINDFAGAHEALDLSNLAFVSGASATVVGSTLVLNGGKIYKFELGGSTAGAYAVASDGHGGSLIDPKTVAFAQAAAALAPSAAARTALVSSTAPVVQTPFAHATASAGAGHL